MRLAAITMVYQSHDMLRRWCQHHGRLIGHENLYIVSHGNDPVHREMAPDANIIGIPRTGLDRFEQTRNISLNGLIQFLDGYFDAVIRTDVDEFLFFDPEKHESLADCLQSVDADAWFAIGFNIFAEPGDAPVLFEQKITQARSLCCVSDAYSKAVAARNGNFLGFHGARDPVHNDDRRMALPEGLYLAHALYARTQELSGISDAAASGLGSSEIRRERNIQHALNLPIGDADAELQSAHNDFSAGFGHWRKKRPNIHVVPRRQSSVSFRLPKRFIGIF